MSNEEIIAAIGAGGNRQQLMCELWQQNSGLIHSIVRKYAALAEIDDLKQTAYIGLDAAARHFNASRGTAFTTVAADWIKQALRRYLDDCGSTVRIPSYMRQKISRCQKARAELAAELGREPGAAELCGKLNCAADDLEAVQIAARAAAPASLDKPTETGDSAGNTLAELLPDRRNNIAEAECRLYHEQLARDLWECVDSLPEKQPDILRARYQQGLTVAAAGQQTGISKEEARKQENRALRALSYGTYRRRLSPYFDEIRSAAMCGVGAARFAVTWTSATEREALNLW